MDKYFLACELCSEHADILQKLLQSESDTTHCTEKKCKAIRKPAFVANKKSWAEISNLQNSKRRPSITSQSPINKKKLHFGLTKIIRWHTINRLTNCVVNQDYAVTITMFAWLTKQFFSIRFFSFQTNSNFLEYTKSIEQRLWCNETWKGSWNVSE